MNYRKQYQSSGFISGVEILTPQQTLPHLRELEQAETSAEIAGILKRAAIQAYPRSEVASLTGESWCRWLSGIAGFSAWFST